VSSVLPVLSVAEENLGLHLLYQLRGAEKPWTDAIIVAIDRKSVRALNLPAVPHKWPRSLHAWLLEALSVQEPAVVALDLIFNAPQSSNEDHAFAEAIRRAGNVILSQPTYFLFKRDTSLASRLIEVLNQDRLEPPLSPRERQIRAFIEAYGGGAGSSSYLNFYGPPGTIETPAPLNALIRNYLGKAYFDEKRGPLDETQFEIVKSLDPKDPTSWFYNAVRKRTLNRPVAALQDLQKSIELNNNRADYRSQFLLDEDLAARSASLNRIYSNLDFEAIALRSGGNSLKMIYKPIT
jgi:hypothetical protein